jgi:leader peptidase (prepilin peptidase)/N-methyltransferase
MTEALSVVALSALTGGLVALVTGPILRRLPEPTNGGDKLPYQELAGVGFTAACSAAAVLAQLVALSWLPLSGQPLWTVLAVLGVLLAAIDARTTWLPLRLTRAAWVLMAVAVAASVALGSTTRDVIRTLAGAAIAGLLYLLVWALTKGGFGFGDVRFAPLLGAALASQSWTLLVWGLTVGTALGAVHGAIRLLRRQQGGFPYAPSMLGGTYLAVVAWRLLVGD